MPTVRPRARDVLPLSPDAAEATLTRRRAADLRRISVVITAAVSCSNIEDVLREWLAQLPDMDAELIVPCPGNGPAWEAISRLAAEDYRLRPIRLAKWQGRAEALQAAIRAMRGDVVVVAGSDNPSERFSLQAVLEQMQRGSDAVLCLRLPKGLPNRLRNGCARGLIGCDAVDTAAPIAVRADVLKHLCFSSRGADLAIELQTRLAQWGAKVAKLPRPESPTSVSALGAARDVWRMLRCRLWDAEFTSHAGFYILTAVAKADQYNRWIVDQVRPFLGRRLMEAGAGIGNLSPLFEDCDRLVLAEREQVYLERLETRFQHDPRVKVASVDLTDATQVAQCADEKIDTIFCSNVLEHLEPDEQVLRSFTEALSPGGHCVLVVPAGERLYTGIDAALGHFRRYEPQDLAGKLRAAGMEVVFTKRFSRLGTLGWAVSGHLLRRRTLSPRQMIWFDRLLPVAKLLERVLPVPGMSLIMVGRKPHAPAQRQRLAA